MKKLTTYLMRNGGFGWKIVFNDKRAKRSVILENKKAKPFLRCLKKSQATMTDEMRASSRLTLSES